jgi:hypothetical protein
MNITFYLFYVASTLSKFCYENLFIFHDTNVFSCVFITFNMSEPSSPPHKPCPSTPQVSQSQASQMAGRTALRCLKHNNSDSSSSSLEEPVSPPSKKSPTSKPTYAFVRDIVESYSSPTPAQQLASSSSPSAANVTPTTVTPEWFSSTPKWMCTEPSRRWNCRQESKDKIEMREKRIKVGALVRKSLTCYGVGGDPTVVVHNVPTLGPIKRLRNCTGRFLVEFDNKVRLELKACDFTFLSNTPEKRILARDTSDQLTMKNTRQAFIDNDVTFLGVMDSPLKQPCRRKSESQDDRKLKF